MRFRTTHLFINTLLALLRSNGSPVRLVCLSVVPKHTTRFYLLIGLVVGSLLWAGCQSSNDPEPNPYGEGNGRVGFWSSLSKETAPTITLKTGQRMTLAYSFATDPTCKSPYLESFTLAAGTYSYEAANTLRRWSGEFTVTERECQMVELKAAQSRPIGQAYGAIVKASTTAKSGTTVDFTLDVVAFDKDGQLLSVPSSNGFLINQFTSGTTTYSFASRGYTLQGAANYGPYSAALLLDQSGSIRENDPQNLRIEAAKLFCQSLGTGDNVALAAFAGSGRSIPYEITTYGSGFTSNGSSYLSTLDDLIRQINGGTPLYKATSTLVNYTASNATNSNKAVIVFTDGEDTEGGVTIDAAISNAKSRQVKLFMVGLGQASTRDLGYMANQTGGSFMFAQDARQLITMFGTLGQLLNGSARVYRTNWRLSLNRTAGSGWITSSLRINTDNGNPLFIPFRLDY